jgi:hypothetical protein
MSRLKELVREVVMDTTQESDIANSLYRLSGLDRNNFADMDTYLAACEPSILKGLWHSAFPRHSRSKVNKPSSTRYLYNKMSITKWIAKPIEEIGMDKTFYVLGNRYTKVADVNRIAAHYNWKWEKTDPAKADFFVLGDNPSNEVASVNNLLQKPVLMDDELMIAAHFLFNKDVTIEDVDNDMVSEFLNGDTYDNLVLVGSMIQYAKKGILSDENMFRLIRSYVTVFKKIDFDLKNKEHIWLSNIVKNYCHPQHRVMVMFLYLKNCHWYTTQSEGRITVSTYPSYQDYITLPGSYSVTNSFNYIHHSKGMDEVTKQDMEEGNKYSLIPKVNIKSVSDYVTSTYSEVIGGKVYRIKMTIKDNPVILLYFMTVKDCDTESPEYCVEVGATTNNSDDHARDFVGKLFTEENWNIVRSKALKVFEDNFSIVNGKLAMNRDNYFPYMDLDETIINNRLLSQETLKLNYYKFKARKNALELI